MGIRFSTNKGGFIFLDNAEKQLMEILVDKTRAAGRILSFSDALKDPEMVTPNSYAYYFGSFDKAAKLAWSKVNSSRQKTDQQKAGTSRSDTVRTIPNSKKPDSASNEAEKIRKKGSKTIDHTHNYTYSQVKGRLIAFYRQNGRMPTQMDVASDPNLPSWTTLCKHLGRKPEWDRLIPLELRKKSITSGDDLSVSQGNEGLSDSKSPKTDDSPRIDESPIAPIVSAPKDNEPAINTRHYWEGDIMHVEVKILKPGNSKPILITLAV